MKKFIILASTAAALATTPAMAAGEGRIEGRGAIGWGGGTEDAFAGPEVSYDTNFDGADLVNVGGRLGIKTGDKGRLYVAAAYELNDAEEFNAAVGYQYSFSDKMYGKVEYRRYFFNGTDLNAAGVGIGVKF
jgi:outer membrane immunogenic protein